MIASCFFGTPSLPWSQVLTTGVLRYLEQLGTNEGTRTHNGVPRSTARGGRSMAKNHLDGTLPAELGKLTNLQILCVTRAAAQPSADRSAPRATRCGGAQQLTREQAQRHDRQLDRLDGESHSRVSAPLRPPGWDA
jgi:hypothetical protein